MSISFLIQEVKETPRTSFPLTIVPSTLTWRYEFVIVGYEGNYYPGTVLLFVIDKLERIPLRDLINDQLFFNEELFKLMQKM